MRNQFLKGLLGLAFSLTLAACGGGGSSGSDSDSGDSGGSTSSWSPTAADTWTIQLTGTLNTSYDVKVYDVDLFDTTQATITALHNAGRVVVCYFSAGSAEEWRDDYSNFAPADKGNGLDGWAGEYWLDTRSDNVRSIMVTRMKLAQSKGCDAVDPDNVDGYTNTTGFALTAATQLDYNTYLAQQAHALGLKVGLKNDVDQLSSLACTFDFAINEQCNYYSECSGYSAFTSLNKPVFNIEYDSAYQNNTSGARDALCTASKAANIRTLVLGMNLDDSYHFSCD
ncbi:endo alpha-1,4 polygalactosaminidase [Aquabacterium sp.]|uniref:endo alpha-1,4 polygalactosaminidase n=1 Tax=Aquabacterium sp. TaxID=1872578 RepID=UPI0035B1E29C